MADVFTFAPDRKALVTGGASGIGLGIATALRGIGAAVAIADLPAALDRADASATGALERIAMDVTDDAAVAGGVAEAARRLGGLDTLVNSAGVFQFRRIEDIATAEWDRMIDINLKGTFLAMREAMPHLKASKRGRVVNLSSDAGKRGFPLLGAYCASKFAVEAYTAALRQELRPHGVFACTIEPGAIAPTWKLAASTTPCCVSRGASAGASMRKMRPS